MRLSFCLWFGLLLKSFKSFFFISIWAILHFIAFPGFLSFDIISTLPLYSKNAKSGYITRHQGSIWISLLIKDWLGETEFLSFSKTFRSNASAKASPLGQLNPGCAALHFAKEVQISWEILLSSPSLPNLLYWTELERLSCSEYAACFLAASLFELAGLFRLGLANSTSLWVLHSWQS